MDLLDPRLPHYIVYGVLSNRHVIQRNTSSKFAELACFTEHSLRNVDVH